MYDKTSKECARAIEQILSKIPDSTYTPKDITYIRSDAGTEFRSAEFNDWCLENSIVFNTAAPNTNIKMAKLKDIGDMSLILQTH